MTPDERRAYHAHYYAARKAAGVCVSCGDPILVPGATRYDPCCIKRAAAVAAFAPVARFQRHEAPGPNRVGHCGVFWDATTLPVTCGRCGWVWGEIGTFTQKEP